jgi:hypothetical protein
VKDSNGLVKMGRLDMAQVQKVLDRAGAGLVAMAGPGVLPKGWRLELHMDLAAVHASIGLDMERLLAAPDVDFFHDICGIMRHIDRSTGDLRDCFLPRCAARKGA